MASIERRLYVRVNAWTFRSARAHEGRSCNRTAHPKFIALVMAAITAMLVLSGSVYAQQSNQDAYARSSLLVLGAYYGCIEEYSRRAAKSVKNVKSLNNDKQIVNAALQACIANKHIFLDFATSRGVNQFDMRSLLADIDQNAELVSSNAISSSRIANTQ